MILTIAERKALTQEQLAKRCGMDLRTLKTHILGRRTPQKRTYHKLANGLGVPVEELTAAMKEGPREQVLSDPPGPDPVAPLLPLVEVLKEQIAAAAPDWELVRRSCDKLHAALISIPLPEVGRRATSDLEFDLVMAEFLLCVTSEPEIDAPCSSGQSEKVTRKRYVQMLVGTMTDLIPMLRAGAGHRALH